MWREARTTVRGWLSQHLPAVWAPTTIRGRSLDWLRQTSWKHFFISVFEGTQLAEWHIFSWLQKAFQSATGNNILHTLEQLNFTRPPTCLHATGEVAKELHADSVRATGNVAIPQGHNEDPGLELPDTTILPNTQDFCGPRRGSCDQWS